MDNPVLSIIFIVEDIRLSVGNLYNIIASVDIFWVKIILKVPLLRT